MRELGWLRALPLAAFLAIAAAGTPAHAVATVTTLDDVKAEPTKVQAALALGREAVCRAAT